MLFQRPNGLHKSTLKVIADTHNLTGCLHLCRQGSLCADEFIKGQTRDLHNTVVQHRLKAGISLACDGVRDLIQCITQGDLGRNLGNGISGSLGSQCRGA